MTRTNRTSLAIFVVGAALLSLAILFVGCSAPQRPDAPQGLRLSPAAPSASSSPEPAAEPPAAPVAPTPGPPVAADPPPAAPLPPAATTCTNADFPKEFTWRTISPADANPRVDIPPRSCTNDYLAQLQHTRTGKVISQASTTVNTTAGGNLVLSMAGAECEQPYQFDIFCGIKNPDGRGICGAQGLVYVGPKCPPPPPPPPTCVVAPAGPCGEWTDVPSSSPSSLELQTVCTPRKQQRSCPRTCGAAAVLEFRTLACE